LQGGGWLALPVGSPLHTRHLTGTLVQRSGRCEEQALPGFMGLLEKEITNS
jgi:hypothetical protein